MENCFTRAGWFLLDEKETKCSLDRYVLERRTPERG